MEVIIYDNTGVLAHEYQHVYTTAPEQSAVASEPFYIIIPDTMQPYITKSGEVALFLPDGLNPYLLHEVLATGRDGMPLIRWIDKCGKYRWYSPGTYSV